jgi:hypothetical protein
LGLGQGWCYYNYSKERSPRGRVEGQKKGQKETKITVQKDKRATYPVKGK